MLHRSSSRRRGFTLMEILIAIAVIVIGLVGVIAVFPVALRDTQSVQDLSISAQLAQSVKAALRAGFANAHLDPAQGYIVTLVHPGRRPDDVPPVSNPLGGAVPAEVLDYIVLPPAGNEDEPPRTFPAHPARDPLKFYELTYEDSSDATTAVRSFLQGTELTDGSDRENAFEALRDPYTQYGFSLLVTPMEDKDNLFMVGIRTCRNPSLYSRLGSSGAFDELGIVKDQFFTILAVR